MHRITTAVAIIFCFGLFALHSYNSNLKVHRGSVLPVDYAEIHIQAGREGRTSGATGASGIYGNEIDWTPIVADEAMRILREKPEQLLQLSLHHYPRCGIGAGAGRHYLPSKQNG